MKLDCGELSAVARSEELDRELSKLKEHMQLVAKKDEQEKREERDRERERYEQVLNSVTESYEERIQQLKQGWLVSSHFDERGGGIDNFYFRVLL